MEPAPLDAPAVATRLEVLLDRVARRRRTHVQLTVSTVDGASSWAGAAGPVAPDGPPLHADQPFFLASISKLHLAVAVLRLVERRLIDLDDPITGLLPQHELAGLHRWKGADLTGQVTVHRLLGHTSGLPDFLEARRPGASSLYEELIRRDVSWTLGDVLAITRQLPARFPPADPGQRRRGHYSETGYALLAAAAETAAGMPYHQLIERELALPGTWRPGHQPRPTEVPEPSPLLHRGVSLHRPDALASLHDLYGTATDNLRLLQGVVTGEAFADPMTAQKMRRHWTRLFHPVDYGLGLMRYRVPRLVGPDLRPLTLEGHTGTTGSWLLHCPELNLLLTGTTDEVGDRSFPFRFAPRVLRAVADR